MCCFIKRADKKVIDNVAEGRRRQKISITQHVAAFPTEAYQLFIPPQLEFKWVWIIQKKIITLKIKLFLM